MKVFVKTVKGVHKSKSEDSVLVGHSVLSDITTELDLEEGVVLVADGVGGNNAGEVASMTLCREVANLDCIDVESLQQVNQTILTVSRINQNYNNMATTGSGIVFQDGCLKQYFHVGNTRIYAIQAGMYLNQITKDDTVVQYLLDNGTISEEEAEAYPARHEITACFGGGKESLFKIKLGRFNNKNILQLLFTSDGVHEYLTIDDIEDVFSESDGNWSTVVNQLVVRAVENGSQDDCTAVIVDFAKIV